MTKENDQINFTKEAFLHPANLVWLLVGTISAFVANGFESGFSSAILSFTLGMELIYLGVLPKLPSYQKSVKLKKEKELPDESGDKRIFHSLDGRSQKRFLVLKHITKEVKKNFETLPYTSKGMLDHVITKMDGLLSTYLSLLDMNRRFQMYMNSEVETEIENEVKKQEKKLENAESDQLKATGKRRLNILNKRLNKFQIAKEKFLICETHLETIEDAIRFIYEQSMTMPNDEDVGLQLDHLLAEMDETTSIIQDLDDSLLPGFDDLDKELELATLKKEAEKLNKSTEKKVKKST
ncbi:MAG TPA: hypothetical protein VKM37_04715 [Balneolaceae bacterium]|nr:hypothetical protein [Balneolaceae bacterium]